jgi:hypothetical protein
MWTLILTPLLLALTRASKRSQKSPAAKAMGLFVSGLNTPKFLVALNERWPELLLGLRAKDV